VSTFAYDGSGATRLRIRETDPLGRVTSYSYLADGSLQAITDPRGLKTTFHYL
jgi:YD repeat-containing protein